MCRGLGCPRSQSWPRHTMVTETSGRVIDPSLPEPPQPGSHPVVSFLLLPQCLHPRPQPPRACWSSGLVSPQRTQASSPSHLCPHGLSAGAARLSKPQIPFYLGMSPAILGRYLHCCLCCWTSEIQVCLVILCPIWHPDLQRDPFIL